jgi:hypothetical protein
MLQFNVAETRMLGGLCIHTGGFWIQLTICAQVIHKGDTLYCRIAPIILYLVPPETPDLVFLAGTLRIQKGSGYARKVWLPSTHIRLP